MCFYYHVITEHKHLGWNITGRRSQQKPVPLPRQGGTVMWTRRRPRGGDEGCVVEGESSPGYHRLSPPLSYRLWPADVANGRAGRCHSKSHFCPLRPARPALTERGSQEEGEKRGKEPTEAFFSAAAFCQFRCACQNKRRRPERGLVREPGWGPSVGRSDADRPGKGTRSEAEPLHMQPQKPAPTGMDSISSNPTKTIKSPFNISVSWK